MIEPTVEQIGRLVDAFWGGHDAPEGSSEDGIMAVLAELARDRCMQPRGHVWNPLDGRPATCGAPGPDGLACGRQPHPGDQGHGTVRPGELVTW